MASLGASMLGDGAVARSTATELTVGAIEFCGATALTLAGSHTLSDSKLSLALRNATNRRDITITRRSSGRPRLEAPYPELAVSIARRDGITAVGFSPSASVGVDLEVDESDLDVMRLAQDHFTPTEAAAVAALGAPNARDLFLRLWCAKEAVLKITGRGIYDGMLKPDFSACMQELRDGNAVARVQLSDQISVNLQVRRLAYAGFPIFYIALAVAS